MQTKFRILPTVLVCICALVILSAGSIFALNTIANRSIVSAMASRAVVQSLAGLELALRDQLDAARYQAGFVADRIISGEITFADSDELSTFMLGSLAAAPQISGVVIANPEGKALSVNRMASGELTQTQFQIGGDSQLKPIAESAPSRSDRYWGPPIYRRQQNDTVLNLRKPIWRGEEYLGFLTVAISTEALSDFALELSDPPRSTVYVLYDRDKVLAHMFLTLGSGGTSRAKPLLTTQEVIDPVMGQLDAATPWKIANFDLPEGVEVLKFESLGTSYVLIQETLNDYADLPLTIGAYGETSTLDSVFRAMYRAIGIGLVMLAIALVVSILLSRMITRPVRQTSSSVATIASLEFDRVEPLPRSQIKEIDDLAQSFNAMLFGLRSFGRYVPQSLVKLLIGENRVGAGTEERELTIMFTDIVGFTPLCEGMSPAEVADFINQHLTLVVDRIQREGGTIDKYIGDAVMAFWGAPNDIDDAPARAARAAVAIERSLAADNREREAAGKPPVRMRIGIHTGPTIVGDIGAPSRINYTVVGDTVNTAQRLEALGKEVDPNAASITLISQRVKEALDDDFDLEPVGRFKMKGKLQPLDVYRIVL